MRLATAIISLLYLAPASFVAATPLTKPQATTEVYKFIGSPVRAEGIAVRSNGQILVSFFDKGEAWLVDPPTKKATKVATFANTTASGAISEVAHDIFAIVAGQYGPDNVPGSWGVWVVDFNTGTATPTTKLVKNVKESSLWNGITAFGKDTVLVGDGLLGAVFKVNLKTGQYGIVIQDPTMAPISGMPFGLDGIRYANGNIYYTNIFAATFYKMPVDAEGKKAGNATQIWDDQQADDMYVSQRGVAYVAGVDGILRATAHGKVSLVASVSNATSVAIGADKSTIFVAGGDGTISSFEIPR